MPNSPEILIRARDAFSAITKKARDEFKGLQADGKALGSSLDSVGANGRKAMDNLRGGTRDAQLALREIGQLAGVELPRAVTSFLARTSLIGPAMSAAFSAVAVVGLIDVLSKMPEAFEKISGAITGWDEKAKKVYQDQIDLNKKYIDTLREVERAEIDLRVRAGMITHTQGATEEIGNTQRDLDAKSAEIGRITTMQNIRRLNSTQGLQNMSSKDVRAALQANGLGGASDDQFRAAIGGNESDADLAKRLEKTKQEAADLFNTITKLKGERLPVATYEDAAKAFADAEKNAEIFKERIKEAQQYQDSFNKALSEYRNATVSGGAMTDEVKAGLKAADEQAKVAIKDFQELKRVLDEAGNEFIKNKEYWDQQLNEFRIKDSGANDPLAKEAEKGTDEISKRIIKQYEEAQKRSKEFMDSFREGAGRVWDDFFLKGKGAFGDLANLGKALLSTITRTLFQDFATNLVFGGAAGAGKPSASSGIIGGIANRIGIGQVFGTQSSGGASAGSGIIKNFAGGGLLGKLAGGSGLLGGLFGASPVAGSLATGAIGIINPATGALVTGTSAGAAGGIGGALGLGGGAGLLGLGAATIPVIGGIAAGIGFALIHFLGNHTKEAPFTRDPHEVEKNRSVLFYTGISDAIDRFSGSVDKFYNKIESLPPDEVVKIGFPKAISNNNQFRKNAGSILMDDV
jgi:hypothetical protein